MGTPIEVTAKTKEKPEPVALAYDFGDNLDEMVGMFGAETVFSNARAQMKIGLQAAMRRYITEGKDVASLASAWKPGVTMERTVDPVAAIKAAFANWSAEDKKKFLRELQAA